MSKHAILKPGKEKAILNKHPWIFSGALASIPPIEEGELLAVFSSSNAFLAQAYFHSKNSIAGRILSFTEEPIAQVLSRQIDEAIALRKCLFDLTKTDCYRLINAEGDRIPGLIVDVYGSVLVIQVNTCGIERLRDLIVSLLIEKLSPQAIYEKSTSSARRQEGLEVRQGFLHGSSLDEIVVSENGIRFLISLEKGQKTGFFLDQREMRHLIRTFAQGKKVLNCFSYSGGFSLCALQGGAKHVTSVDSSADALRLAQLSTELNRFDPFSHTMIQADVFDILKDHPCDYDLMILDPPAFAKKRADVIAACSGYQELNRLACKRLPPRSLLLTCSCSHFIDEELFQNVVFQAARAAGREVQIISRHHQAADHPISLSHPEGKYLKSLLLYLI
jgi:23S rRNA (cytosine1962-C5)-methyltransferase